MNKKILKTDKLACIDRRIDHIRKSVTTNVELFSFIHNLTTNHELLLRGKSIHSLVSPLISGHENRPHKRWYPGEYVRSISRLGQTSGFDLTMIPENGVPVVRVATVIHGAQRGSQLDVIVNLYRLLASLFYVRVLADDAKATLLVSVDPTFNSVALDVQAAFGADVDFVDTVMQQANEAHKIVIRTEEEIRVLNARLAIERSQYNHLSSLSNAYLAKQYRVKMVSEIINKPVRS